MRNDGRIVKTFTFDGKRYYVYGRTEKEAYTKMANKQRDLKEGKAEISCSMTVSAWTAKAVETYKTNQKEITRKAFIGKVNKHILSQIGHIRLDKVKPLQCQKVLNELEGMSSAYINDIYQALNFIFSKAVENNLILKNPAEHLTKPKGYKSSRRAITEEERTALYKACEVYDKLYLFRFMLECGCRTSEAAGLQGKDVMLIEGQPMLHIRGTKTKAADRIVPLSKDLYEKFKNTSENDFIVSTANYTKFKETGLARLVLRLYREMNIAMGCKLYRNELIPPYPLADDFVPYCLRHTYCTDLQRKGIPLTVAQKLMGHSSIQMTANIYTHVDQSDILEAAKLLR